MGCLLLPFELIFDGMIEGYFALMQWIVPNRIFGERVRIILKIFAGIFTSALLFFMILGIFAMLNNDEGIKYIGKLMFFIPLGISIVQIIIGIVIHYISNKKR